MLGNQIVMGRCYILVSSRALVAAFVSNHRER